MATARGLWGSLAYGYTLNGDRAQEVLTPAGGTALTTVLSYPATSNRLARTSVGSLTTRSFTYDAAGNLLTQVMGPLRLAFAYNQRNRPVTLTRTGDGTQVSSYLYNALEQLVQRSTTAPGGPSGTVHYLYNLDGALLAEADAATGAVVRDDIWLPQDDASPAADNDNEEGASPPPLPLAVVTGENTTTPQLLMVQADHLNRPLRLTDAARATVWAAAYDPFGQPWQVTGSVEQNLRFPGQYFLLESGLSYNWHRIYDPATGRYTQPDPLRFVDGPSVYGYAGQSPLMRVDPLGQKDQCLPGSEDLLCIIRGGGEIGGGPIGGGVPIIPFIPPVSPSPKEPEPPPSPGPQCTFEFPIGQMPPIDRPAQPGGRKCACTCRAGDANVGKWAFGFAVAKRCNIAAQLACKAAVNDSGVSHNHHASAKCSDGNSYAGSGKKLGGK